MAQIEASQQFERNIPVTLLSGDARGYQWRAGANIDRIDAQDGTSLAPN
jgi:hypothetical protein